MPIYEYRCTACSHEHETLQKFSDAPLTDCPACGKPALTKLISAAGFHLKGTGWYATDFKSSGKSAAKSETNGEAKSDAGGEAKSESGGAKTETGSAKTEGGGAKTETAGTSSDGAASSGAGAAASCS